MRAQVRVVDGSRVEERSDDLATEEPLELRVLAGGAQKTVAVTMRTPGNDFELSAGFLFSEGVVHSREEIRRITYCVDPAIDAEQQYNIVNVDLARTTLPDLASLERSFFTSSACGVCGKASLEALRLRGFATTPPGPTIRADLLSRLPEKLRSAQGLFEATGGLHAAALFDVRGTLISVREDVGRHNALDKLIGWALLEARIPLRDHIVMVSGRASFELVQKSLVAGIPIFCAVSAPSSLAVELARDFGMTMVGFLRGDRFNIYTGFERVQA
ncbi:MAG: formate dehydrogenase accessory sulfurtransferase FdhD [Armatimonadota bacterium]